MRSPGRATALPGEEETEPRQTGLRRPGENLTNCHREAKVTAPLLDSTQNPAGGGGQVQIGAAERGPNKLWLPITMLRCSLNPPIIAPIRLTPKNQDGFTAWRKVVQKVRPAKKIGRGTTSKDHSSRWLKVKARIDSRLTK